MNARLFRCQSIHLFSPKKQKEEEFTPWNIKNPGSYQGTQSWKVWYLSKKSQTIQETEEVWLSILGLRNILMFHQGETTGRNERLEGRVLGTKGKGRRGILHRRSIYSIKFHEIWKVIASRLSTECISVTHHMFIVFLWCIKHGTWFCGYKSKHYRHGSNSYGISRLA